MTPDRRVGKREELSLSLPPSVPPEATLSPRQGLSFGEKGTLVQDAMYLSSGPLLNVYLSCGNPTTRP